MTAGDGTPLDQMHPASPILVAIEGERRDQVIVVLEKGGMDVAQVAHLAEANAAIAELAPALVVTDHPAADQLDPALRNLLGRSAAPVIVIAGTRQVGVAALEAGAADYLVEPLEERELLVRAALRAQRPAELVDAGDLQIDRVARRVQVRGVNVELTSKEYQLLLFLAMRPNQAFSREELLQAVWTGASSPRKPGTVTEHIYRLRNKIEPEPSHPTRLITVRGTGYRFDP